MERVLLVEDDYITNAALREHLEEVGFQVESVYSGAEALAAIERQPPQSLITDISLGSGPNGFDVARFAQLTRPGVRVVIISSELSKHAEPTDVAASAFIAKPFRFERVEAALREAPILSAA